MSVAVMRKPVSDGMNSVHACATGIEDDHLCLGCNVCMLRVDHSESGGVVFTGDAVATC